MLVILRHKPTGKIHSEFAFPDGGCSVLNLEELFGPRLPYFAEIYSPASAEPPADRPKVLGAWKTTPEQDPLGLRIVLHGFHVNDDGMVIALREVHTRSVEIPDPPPVIAALELWFGEYLLANMPFRVGEGHWMWIPPAKENQE